MPTHLFPAASRHARPQLSPLTGVNLAQGRAHEACGPARHRFALWLAAAVQGPVLWIAPAWSRARLNPDGMAECTNPGRFLFVQAARPEDLLWSMEEALRSGAVPLVVAELPEPPGMTPVRRLHLAAENAGEAAGAQSSPRAAGGPPALPLGLLLTPGEGGARGIESRWHLAPAHPPGALRPLPQSHAPDTPPDCPPGWAEPRQWQLQCLRARTSPPRRWLVRQAAPGAPLQAAPVPALAAADPQTPPPPPPQPPRTAAPPAHRGTGTAG